MPKKQKPNSKEILKYLKFVKPNHKKPISNENTTTQKSTK